jgi:hypothetical protein
LVASSNMEAKASNHLSVGVAGAGDVWSLFSGFTVLVKTRQPRSVPWEQVLPQRWREAA